MTFWNDPINFIAQWLQTLLVGWGVSADLAHFILIVIGAGLLGTGTLIWTIFLIWYERKLIGRIQDRPGPNRVGPFGLIQPIADMLKIFTKEYVTPQGADKIPYNLAPILVVAGTIMIWGVIPLSQRIWGVNLSVAVLYLVAAGAIADLGIIFAGWGSNNKYALLGAFRVIAQMISYEVPMIITLLIPVMFSGSMSLNGIVEGQGSTIWYVFMAPVAALIFMITQIAEVGRAPFDLIEAESEIVAGFNIEYSGLKFGMFYVGEFLHSFTVALVFATLFLGGWQGPFADKIPFLGIVYLWIKTFLIYFTTVLIRGSLPRFRIDQMMDINWKLLTPLSLALLMVTAIVQKIVPNMVVVQVVANWVVNGIIGVITLQLLRNAVRARRRPMVSPRPYPQTTLE